MKSSILMLRFDTLKSECVYLIMFDMKFLMLLGGDSMIKMKFLPFVV